MTDECNAIDRDNCSEHGWGAEPTSSPYAVSGPEAALEERLESAMRSLISLRDKRADAQPSSLSVVRLDGKIDGVALALSYLRDSRRVSRFSHHAGDDDNETPTPLPIHRTEAGYPNCSTCDGGGCPDCTDPA